MLPPLALFNMGPWEIAIILLLALLLFGGSKLPSIAKDLGTGIKEFKKSLSSAVSSEEQEQPSNSTSTFKEEETPKKGNSKKS